MTTTLEQTTMQDLTTNLDYYKPTMSQLAFRQEPYTDVRFTFKNRGSQRLLDYVDPVVLQEQFDVQQERGWTEHEIGFLGSLALPDGRPAFGRDYLQHLAHSDLPPVQVIHDKERDDIAITTEGDWSMASFWETVVMAGVNEQYFENYLQAWDIDPRSVYEEGDRRLSAKIATLKEHPDIKIADFGTRRHFSAKWQEHVVGRLAAECPNNLVGTSNVALAQKFGIKPIGTFAHEMPMVYAGLADARNEGDPAAIRASHGRFLDDWYAVYGAAGSVALTDTFTTDFFFDDFSSRRAETWRGVRHDSGDPVAFGEQLIEYYEQNGIDPRTKTVVFSDGLDMKQIVDLHEHFKDRIDTMFGWGTTLTNDMGMGLKPLNIVMKATHVLDRILDVEADTVKLSDNPGKHTGPDDKVREYQEIMSII